MRRLANLPVEAEAESVRARLAVTLPHGRGPARVRARASSCRAAEGDPGRLSRSPGHRAPSTPSPRPTAPWRWPPIALCCRRERRCGWRLWPPRLKVADLTLIGSHCRGVDLALGMLRRERRLHGQGHQRRLVGRRRGLRQGRDRPRRSPPARSGESGVYNRAARERLGADGVLIKGYVRRQGIYYRKERLPGTEPPTLDAAGGKGGASHAQPHPGGRHPRPPRSPARRHCAREGSMSRRGAAGRHPRLRHGDALAQRRGRGRGFGPGGLGARASRRWPWPTAWGSHP